ncbi:FAD-dependent oxidoreductase [Fictibacillus enclensis]|uniref:FAD-dependent oxidoreductase n=1 Tax=Fictibacillus enclensis TaxID=1017270 RepID=UPI0025A2CFC6|nr:FAD-dependent oxidoreductase [Fictibacillus enclensis]MDM5198164.1 FAD-dependent oxidoreductase [Fictibacillus enclensis]
MLDMDCDVLVIGGGVTGVAAATAAARNGANTILLESKPFLGGNATTGLCLHNFITRYGRQVVFGIAQEIVDRLIKMGGAVGHIPYGGFVHSVTPVDGELFRILSTELLDEAGVIVFLGVNVVGTVRDRGNVTGVQVAVKGGIRTIRAKTYIDASGDADVVAAAGANYTKGDRKTGKMQPVSMVLRCYGTNNKEIAQAIAVSTPAMATRADHPEPIPVYFNGAFSQWNDIIRENQIFPNEDHKVFFNTVWPNHINVNTSAVVGIDGTDPLSLSRATVELTKQVYRISHFLKENVPGFQNAYFVPSAFAGVRETRRIEGLYEITDEDVTIGRKFEDTIGQICFPVDIHDPDTGQASFYQIGDDGAFDIPFRALIPKGLQNILVAGRCVSATSFANGATRNMAPCLVMGQSAGVAAAMASQQNLTFTQLNIHKLQENLEEQGVYLGERSNKRVTHPTI